MLQARQYLQYLQGSKDKTMLGVIQSSSHNPPQIKNYLSYKVG